MTLGVSGPSYYSCYGGCKRLLYAEASQVQLLHILWWSKIVFSQITPAILNRSRRNFTQWLDSEETLLWKLWAASVKGGQNGPGKIELFYQRDKVSAMPFHAGNLREIWRQHINRCSHQSFWKRIANSCPKRRHLHQKPTFSGMFQWMSCSQARDKLMSFWVKITIPPYSPKPRMCLCSVTCCIRFTVFQIFCRK